MDTGEDRSEMAERADGFTAGSGKRIKPTPEISTVAVARPVWRSDESQLVTWSSQGEVPTVDICLHELAINAADMCAFVKTLVRTANNSGSSEVLVPAGLSPSQYIVRVQSSVNSSVFADTELTVECAGGAPAISEVAVQQLIWHGGSRQQVTWSSQGEVPAVDIDLYRASADALDDHTFIKTLARTANNSGSHEVLVPAGLTPGQYVVRVESRVNSAVFADSAEFTVMPTGAMPALSTVVVARPVWRAGQQEVVTWSSQGEVPAVDVDLYRASADAVGGHTLVMPLVHGANNSGSSEVLVPAGLTPGQYVVRVESRVNRSVFADSAEFTVDDEHRERCVRYALLLLGLPSACKLPYALIRKVAVAAATD